MLFKKLSITLLAVFLLSFHIVDVQAAQVLLGGESIGIELNYDGVLISGTYDISIDNKQYNPSSAGIRPGDLITHVNNTIVKSISKLMECIKKDIDQGKPITLTLSRNQKIFEYDLKYEKDNEQFSTGLYVQDGLSGIGTMTYYNPSSLRFGALGHMMNDVQLSTSMVVKKGKVYNSYVKRIKPSRDGKPGEKIADIGSIEIGTVLENNNFGIYGTYDKNYINNKQSISTASMDEVKKGDAYFLTVLNGHKVEKCSIKITKLKKQNNADIKGITFEVTDKKVLSLSNGIIQGMSGSPIIQDGKLIGCVTHVDVNHVHIGYGIYIDWMLENSD